MTATLDQSGVERSVIARVALTPLLIAEAFASMSDEAQAQFFIEVAEYAKGWKSSPSMQWGLVGAHLRDCACSTPEARDLVQAIADGCREDRT